MAIFNFRFSIFNLFCVLLMSTVAVCAQETQINRIEITNYNSMEFDQSIAPDAQRLIGEVQFLHDNIVMTCDSAYYYSSINTLDAFSRVHIVQSDSSTVDGNFAKYQGNTKFAEIWDSVVLVDKDALMKTQHLYYDLNTNIAYYLEGAKIFNQGNDMVSQTGYYHRNINTFYFKKDVVLNTPDYTIVTDTLDYNVHTKIADFVGPTYIQNDKDTIFCERGWYNTNDTVSLFRKNAWIKSGSTIVDADTLYYESGTGNGQAFGNIQILDTTNNVILRGHIGRFNNLTEKAWMTKEALMIMIGKEDSLFLHADTLRSDVDTSDFKIVKAYNKVKFFSIDMQGMCDSLYISFQDTVIRMYNVPVLWAQDNQMTAEYIEIETENQQPKQMNLLNKGFIASQEDSTGFNQVRGKKIIGRFRKGNELYRISVYEDGESVYYTKDGDFLTGVNKAAGPDIVIELEEKKVQQITYIGATVAELIPVNEFDPTELTLLGFNWLEKHKPQNKNEIFHWGERKIENDTTLSISVAQNETIDSLRCKIELLISGKQAHIGVAVMGSKDKDTLTVNNGAHYPTMSVYKYHIALAVLRMVDFGRLRLDQKIRIAKEDLHPDMYSPLRDDYPKGNMDLTLSELMAYMVSKSDNNACDILLRLMNGPKRVDQLVKSMGLTDVSIAVTEREMHEDSTLINQNWTSPFAMVQALEIQRREDVLSANSRNVLWKLLTETTIGNEKIRGKLPPTTVVGHKTGSSYRDAEGIKLVDNDAAIILLPENQYFIVSIFITDSKEDDRTDAAIMADIARLTWNFYTRNK